MAVEFSSSAKSNLVDDIVASEYVVQAAADRTNSNRIITRAGSNQRFQEDAFAPPTTESANFLGNADDCLAFASSRLTVTTSGDSVTSGAWSNVFVPDASSAVWTGLDSATIKVDFGSSQTYLFGAGVLFGFGSIADGVLIEYSTNDSDYTTIINATGNSNYHVGRIGKSFSWLI